MEETAQRLHALDLNRVIAICESHSGEECVTRRQISDAELADSVTNLPSGDNQSRELFRSPWPLCRAYHAAVEYVYQPFGC